MKETLKLALEALEEAWYHVGTFQPTEKAIDLYDEARTAIKEALAQEQEPVAWNVIDPTGKIVATEENAIRGWARIHGYKLTVEGLLGFHEKGWRVVPATAPQQRTWVGLTDEEIDSFREANSEGRGAGWRFNFKGFARAIEAAHGIKE